MNRKLYALLLPVIGGAVIVGSGFSAWYFNEATVSKSTEGTGTVEGLIDTGVLTINHETFTFTLDQGGRENATDATKGITITEGQLSFTYVGDKGYENSVFAQEKTLSYTYTFALSSDNDALLNYIQLAETTGSFTASEGVQTNQTVDFPALIYKDKPETAQEYKAMIDALNGGAGHDYSTVLSGLDLTITVTVTAVEGE